MYASLGQVYRKAWKMWGGGPDSGLYKSELDGYSSRLDAIMNTELPALNERLATVGLDTIERNDSR